MPKRKQQEQTESSVAPRLKAGESQATITLPVMDDGSVDWSSVRDSTKEKFKGILSNDPTALEMVADVLGDIDTDDSGSEDGTPTLTEANIGSVIDKINMGCAFGLAILANKFKKHPALRDAQGQPIKMAISPEVILSLKLTEAQHKELDPRAFKIGQKYMEKLPESVKKNFDGWMLAIMFLEYQAQNFNKMITIQTQKDLAAVLAAQAKQGRAIPPDSDKANGKATSAPSGPHEGESLEPGFIPPDSDQPRV